MTSVLDVKMELSDYDNVDGVDTIRDYLKALLITLWSEREGFSGKRPFGNSSWEYALYKALVKSGHVSGRIDEEYDDLLECDEKHADELIFQAIEDL